MKKQILLVAAIAIVSASYAGAAQTNNGCQGNCDGNGPSNNANHNSNSSSAVGIGTGIGMGGAGGNSSSNSQATGGSVSHSGNSVATGGSVSNSGNSYSTNNTTVRNDNANVQGQTQGQSQSSKNSNRNSNANNNRNQNASNANNSNSNANSGNNAAQSSSTVTTVQGDTYVAARIPVATAYAPNNVPTATCMGSSSVGFSAVGFSASGGSSWIDENCQLLEQVRTVSQVLGQQDVAAEMMRAVPAYRDALVRLGKMPAPKSAVSQAGALDAAAVSSYNTQDSSYQVAVKSVPFFMGN